MIGGGRRSAWVYLALACYVAGFLLFAPRALLIIDEFHYVTQAMAFAQGEMTLPGATPLYPPSPLRVASDHPPGTSLLQTPLVALVGWRGGAALSMIALVVATLLTMKWLREQGKDPEFAILVPAFLGTLFFGRIAMSDVPSAAFVALALWSLFRAEGGGSAKWSFASGFVAGASLLLRETNAVLLLPVFLGALLRGNCRRGALIAGAVVAIGVRLAVSAAMFGDPLYLRNPEYGFSLRAVWPNLTATAVILIGLFPLGALLPFWYRGPRRAEFVVAVAAYVALFVCYDYSGVVESGRVRGLLLTSRFMVPMLPLLAFMAADVWPRWVAAAPGYLRRVIFFARPAACAGVAAAAFLIHPAVRRQESVTLAIVQAIGAAVEKDVPVVTNHEVTLKYLSPVYGTRPMILRSFVKPEQVGGFLRLKGRVNVLFLDRTDTDKFREDAHQNAAFLEALRRTCEVQPRRDAAVGPMRMHVYAIERCRA